MCRRQSNGGSDGAVKTRRPARMKRAAATTTINAVPNLFIAELNSPGTIAASSPVQRLLGFFRGDFLLAPLNAIAESQDEHAPEKPGEHIPHQRADHRGIHAGILVPTKNRRGVLRSPPAVRHVYDRHVKRAEDAQDGGEGLHLW